MNHTLDTFFAGWEHAAVHEYAPVNDLLARHCSGYSCSPRLDASGSGLSSAGLHYEGLARLPFPDGSFDILISQDVLEHVGWLPEAVREIQRVLKQEGAHVFTTPKHRSLARSRPRVRRDGDEVTYLEDAHYHGDPTSHGRELVTWDFGADVEALITQWSGAPTMSYVERDRHLGLDGEFLDVFVTRRIAD